MAKDPKIRPNGISIYGKHDPNLRRCWCFKVKQPRTKLVLISDPELSSVCTYAYKKIN